MEEVWRWIQDHAQVLSAIGTAVMALVWLVYLQLFYVEHRRRRRSQLEIQQSAAQDLDAPCLIANMSAQPVFVICAMVVIECSGGDERLRQLSVRRSDQGGRQLRQGPLAPGETLDLGPLRDMLADDSGEIVEDAQAVELRVVALHGSSRDHVGALRRYEISRDGGMFSLRPTTLDTRQLRRRGESRQVRRWAEQCVTLRVPPWSGPSDRDAPN